MTTTAALTPLPVDHYPAWRAAVRERLVSRRLAPGHLSGAEVARRVERLLARRLPDHLVAAHERVWQVGDPGPDAGWLWLDVVAEPDSTAATVVDLCWQPDPGATPAAVLDAVEALARGRGADVLRLSTAPGDPCTPDLLRQRGYELATTQLVQHLRHPSPRDADGPALVLRPMTDDEYAAFVEAEQLSYAADLQACGAAGASEAARRAAEELIELLPQGRDTPGALLWTGWRGEQPVGSLWVGVEDDGRQLYVLQVVVPPALRGQGNGRALMRALQGQARERGASCIGLSVFGFNTTARRLYDSLGYEVVDDLWCLDL